METVRRRSVGDMPALLQRSSDARVRLEEGPPALTFQAAAVATAEQWITTEDRGKARVQWSICRVLGPTRPLPVVGMQRCASRKKAALLEVA